MTVSPLHGFTGRVDSLEVRCFRRSNCDNETTNPPSCVIAVTTRLVAQLLHPMGNPAAVRGTRLAVFRASYAARPRLVAGDTGVYGRRPSVDPTREVVDALETFLHETLRGRLTATPVVAV